jgi:SAM-dependent methyltransferase/uncharacterized protein YbaR (Trm112 family)
MRIRLLDKLHCPYSGSRFVIQSKREENEKEIRYGVAASEAGEFPIVEGILRLQVDELRAPITSFVRDGRFKNALMTALDEVPFHGKKGAAINFVARTAFKLGHTRAAMVVTGLKNGLYLELIEKGSTFVETANRLSAGSLANWQIYRFSMPTFLPVLPLLHLLKEGDQILDFGCGTGQASFLMSRMVKDVRILCADYSFSSLYLSKKYFVPDADYICLDGDYPLPFDTGQFSYVFSSDALHCIDSKLSLSSEFKRVLSHKGTLVLPHLHNKLSKVSYGKSLSPSGYKALFEGMDARVLPEDSVVTDYFRYGTVDLEKEWSDKELEQADIGLSLVAGKGVSAFHRYSGLWDQYIDRMNNPILNPVYLAEKTERGIRIRKEIAEPFCRTVRFDNENICLPESLVLDLKAFDRDSIRSLRDTNRKMFMELCRKLILIEVPEGFI